MSFVSAQPLANFPNSAVNTIGSVQKQTDWLGTARGRLGYAWSPSFLLYVTGGLAYGGVKSTTVMGSSLESFGGVAIDGAAGRYSSTRVGWTLGGGVEWMFIPNVSLKAEYLHYNLGSATYNGGVFATSAPFFGTFQNDVVRTRVRYDGHILRAGLNYHFNGGASASVLAKY